MKIGISACITAPRPTVDHGASNGHLLLDEASSSTGGFARLHTRGTGRLDMRRAIIVFVFPLATLVTLNEPHALAQSGEENGTAVHDAFAWGFTAFEMSTGVVLYSQLNRRGRVPVWQHVALSYAPIVTGVGVGFLSHYSGWNGDAGRATHGAFWGGIGGIALGSALDGYIARRGLRFGQWAYTFGFTGAVAAAWLGATQIDPETETALFMAVPATAAIGGFAIGGVTALILSFNRRQRLGFRILGLSVAGGVAIGLLASSLSNPSPDEPVPGDVRGPVQLPRPIMLSVPFSW